MLAINYVLRDGTTGSYSSEDDDFGEFCYQWWWNLVFEAQFGTDIAPEIKSCSLTGNPTGSGSKEQVIDEGVITYAMFNQLTNLQTVDVSGLNVSGMTDFNGMFDQCRAPIIDVSMWDMSHSRSCASMFLGCHATTIYLPATLSDNGQYVSINISNCTDLQYMFSYCNHLQHVMTKVGSTLPQYWETGSVTNLNRMFYECYVFLGLNGNGFRAYNWNVSNVVTMTEMFERCYVLPYFGMDNNFMWNCSSVTNMDYMFLGCYSLTTANEDKWIVTSRTTSMINMFYMPHIEGHDSSALPVFKAPNWNVSNVINFGSGFFSGCNNLTFIDITNWSMASALTTVRFCDCTSLKTIVCDHDWAQEIPSGCDQAWPFMSTPQLSGAISFNTSLPTYGALLYANPTTGYFTSGGRGRTRFLGGVVKHLFFNGAECQRLYLNGTRIF